MRVEARSMALGRRLFVVAACTVLPVSAACSNDDSPPDGGSMAYVIGAHANAPAAADVDAVLGESVSQERTVALVALDGAPHQVWRKTLRPTSANKEGRADERAAFLGELRHVVGTIAPMTPETDWLAGVAAGAAAIADAPAPKSLVVEDSGLATAGLLRFQRPGMLDAAPAEVADWLAQQHALPELTGVDVEPRGVCDVAPPQPRIGVGQCNNVKAILRAVLERAGATVAPTDRWPSRQGDAGWPPGVPPVTVISAPEPVYSAEPVALPAAEFFVAETDELIDPVRAADSLRPLAEQAIRADARVELVGTTARVGDRDGQIRLSEQRAEKLKQVLVDQLGVPADRIATSGVGSDGPWYVPDHDPAGTLLPSAAAQNRTVRVTVRQG